MSHVGAGGSWKEWLPGTGGTGTAVGAGGAWKSVVGCWVGSGGAWKKFFTATGTVSFSGATASHTSGSVASASVTFKADGSYSKAEGGVETVLGNWLDPQLGMTLHSVRFTNLVNVTPSTTDNTAEDAWFSFGDGDFSLSLLLSQAGGQESTFDIEVRLGTGAALDSASFTLDITRT